MSPLSKPQFALAVIRQTTPPWVTRWVNLSGIIRQCDEYASQHDLPTYTDNPRPWQLVDWWPFPAACNARVFRREGDKKPWALPFRLTGSGPVSGDEPTLWEG